MSVEGRARSYQKPEGWDDLSRWQPREASPEERLDMALAWTAHELRGPVLATRAALDRVLVSDSLASRDRRLLVRSRDVLRELSGQIDAVLRWAAGARRLRKRRTDLGRLVRRVVTELALPAEESRLSVLIQAGVTVRADGPLLRAAVADVIRNALDYSPSGSPVSVRVQERSGSVRIAVRDRGPGVPAEDRPALFEPFVRGRGAPRRAGTGLGLFIARRVVEAHGGEIWLESTGHGTTVVLQLPSEETAP
ncbi:MAG: sensor histidine kinase [Actinomycetota bacterium]|nr:sensor histidine kinase [Actinomycetota bacterium]